MDKRKFEAHRRRIIALRKARETYIDAEIEHLRFRELGSTGKLPKKVETKLREYVQRMIQQIEIENLTVMNRRLPHMKGDHYEGDGCVRDK